VEQDCDVYVVQNCVKYELADLKVIKDRPAVKYWHDVGPVAAAGCARLARRARHADLLLTDPGRVHGPRSRPGASSRRSGALRGRSEGHERQPRRRGQHRLLAQLRQGAAQGRTSGRKGDIDFYGDGVLAPQGSSAVRYEDMPALMARYQTFVFLPTVIEPFGRLVAEAWASGCELVTNRLVGSLHWIENDPDAIETAASDFWQIALRDQ
jgi:glycosyltransferase involved in cell wall biosynthesis